MQPGDVFAGRFVLERLAGAGGMGAVWRALDRVSGEPIALKVILNPDEEQIARFQREARVLAGLQHPAITRHVDHGATTEGRHYLAMEWLEGEDLAARLSRGALGIDESQALAERVAEALAVVHARGVIHRDLKPANLFLPAGDLGRIKLLDFGIARLTDATRGLTATGAAIGSPAYMAPEQARGEPGIDARADVYALGCVLFECLTGRPPFIAGHPLAVLVKVLFEDMPRPGDFRPTTPAALDALVARLCAKVPAQRPADGSWAARELRAVAAGVPDARSSAMASASALTRSERRLVSIVLAKHVRLGDRRSAAVAPRSAHASLGYSDTLEVVRSPPVDSTQRSMHTIWDIADRYRARMEVLQDGSVAALIAGAGAPADLAASAARFALEIRALLPASHVTLATGWVVMDGTQPLGQVIDRAGALLEHGPANEPLSPRAVLIEPTTAALLGDDPWLVRNLRASGVEPPARLQLCNDVGQSARVTDYRAGLDEFAEER